MVKRVNVHHKHWSGPWEAQRSKTNKNNPSKHQVHYGNQKGPTEKSSILSCHMAATTSTHDYLTNNVTVVKAEVTCFYFKRSTIVPKTNRTSRPGHLTENRPNTINKKSTKEGKLTI